MQSGRHLIYAKTLNSALSPIKTDADVQRACVIALSDERIIVAIHTTPEKVKLVSYGNDADVMTKRARIETNGSIAEKGDRIYEDRTPLKVQPQIPETLVDMCPN